MHSRTGSMPEPETGRPPERAARTRWFPAIVAVLAVLSAMGIGTAVWLARDSTPLPTPNPTAAPTQTATGPAGQPLAPKTGALVGSWVKPTAAEAGDVTAAVGILQQGIGRQLDIVHVYRKWTEAFPGQTERDAIAQGSTPMISWAGAETTAIASGAHDAKIRQRAAAVRELGVPVLLRWFWEMDRPNVAARAGSGADYVAAWRHLRSIFAAAGVTNAQWVWCPTSFGFAEDRVDEFYPGDDSVDWLCADGYTGPSIGGWRSFQEVFQSFYDWAAEHPQPLMIGEFGVPAGAPGQREAWLRDARQALKSEFPRIKAVVYFDAIRMDGKGNRNVWTLRGYPEALAAFRELVNDQYFNTRRLPVAG